MFKKLFIILIFVLGLSCAHHSTNPSNPTPVPTIGPPNKSGVGISGTHFTYNNKPIMLIGYGSYNVIANVTDLKDDAAVINHLNSMSSNKVNLQREFITVAGRFGPYIPVGNTDYILTKSRANELGYSSQWYDPYWNRLNVFAIEAEKRGIVIQVVPWDHWVMYTGQNYKLSDKYTFWDLFPYNPGGHFQCYSNGVNNPPNCEDFIPCSELKFCANHQWPVPANDLLLFNDGAFYKDIAGRRQIMKELLDKLIDTLGPRKNIIWECMNEPRDGTPDQIFNWHVFVKNTIKARLPKAIITSTPADYDNLFHQPWVNFAAFHGLAPGADCNASNIPAGLTNQYNKPILIDDDGCWAGACYIDSQGRLIHTNRADPNFIRAAIKRCKELGYNFNTKQDDVNLNSAVLQVIKEESPN
jgi:hypothetical protein